MTVIQKFKDELKKTLGLLMADSNQPEIKVSEFVIGGKVETVNADGTLAPAPDGEYTIDKDVIEVKDGQIVSINGETESKPADKPADEKTPVEELAVDNGLESLQAEVDALKAETESLKSAIEELKKGWADDKTAEQTMSADFSKQLSDLNETLKVLSTLPVEFSKTNQSATVKDAKENKMQVASNLWSNRK